MRGATGLGAEERRVLGALAEKALSTPDHYPLTRAGLIDACNQTTSRDPVVTYDEATVRAALSELGDRRLTRAASGPGSRAPKHRHLLRETLDLAPPAQAVLALLLLRGPQTAAELRQRSARLHAFADGDAVEATLGDLTERGLVADVGRRPGERGTRWAHRMGGDGPDARRPTDPGRPVATGCPTDASVPADPCDPAADDEALAARVDTLERDLAAARTEVADVRAALDALRRDLGA